MKNNKYKVIVAHPGKQHSFKLATALKKDELLFKYVTTVYNKETSLIMRIIKFFVNKENKKRINSRKNNNLKDEDIIQYGELRGIIEIFLARYDKKKKIYTWWNRKNSYFFGKKVAKLAMKENVDAVIMYDTNAKECFEILEKEAPSILRIMDVSAANRLYMKEIYEKDMKKTPLFAKKLKEETQFIWDRKLYKELEIEIQKTQLFLSPSHFVKESLIFSGVKEEKIKVCSYGTNFELIKRNYKIEEENSILRAIYIGNVTEMKGIYYLLEAVSEIPKDKLDMTIVGEYNNRDGIFNKYMERVNFTGRVLPERVKELLEKSDIFIFPSLGDGLGLAVLEAMSCGLPCIVTSNTGAKDMIIDGKNGFIINIQNKDILKEKIYWFIENKKAISEMGNNAIEISKKYTWKNYEQNIVKIIREALDTKLKDNII